MRATYRLVPMLALAIGVAACVPSAAPPLRPFPKPTAVAPPPAPPATSPSADWRDWPLTPGDWVYRQDARGSIALFGMPGADAVVTLRCDRAAGVLYLSRSGSGPAARLTLRTSTLVRTLDARPAGGSPAYLAVAIPSRDMVLEAMGFSRGRFVLQQAGLPALVIPAWPEILRVTEDCRG